MIVSFHPCYEADLNLLCAGQDPTAAHVRAIRSADAVILPQGCRRTLYEAAAKYCSQVFPDYYARFNYPGKLGQAGLFKETETAHPQTFIYSNTRDLLNESPHLQKHPPIPYPIIFKFDWGGEGDSVFRIDTPGQFNVTLKKARAFEKSGHSGFLLQEYIACNNRSLRVCVIGESLYTYWRIQTDPAHFHTSTVKGALIDKSADPDLRHAGVLAVQALCAQTRINLAGIDLIFPEKGTSGQSPLPLFLEINHFFGRRGLGGSEPYYRMLTEAINQWIKNLPDK